MLHAENGKKQRGKRDHTDNAPAIERMQKTHDAVLVFKGTRFHDRADQHLDQTATHRIHDNADENTDKRIAEKGRQKRQSDKPDRRQDLRKHHAFPVADRIHEFGTEHINEDLQDVKDGGDQRDLPKGDVIFRVKPQKQQRSEICHDRLRDKAEIASGEGLSVFACACHTVPRHFSARIRFS